VATSDTPLTYSGTAGSSTAASTGALSGVAGTGDALTGSVSIQVGSGTAQTVNMPPLDHTLSGLADAINKAETGVKASVGTNSAGLPILSFLSGTAGSVGTLKVTSNILDTTKTSSKTLNYTNSSDVSGLGNLGISVNNDGSIALDAAQLDSTLNTDYGGVVGFFQSANSWGQTFANTLTSGGAAAGTGVLSLVSSSNRSIEATLNADIAKEETQIAAQQKSLTTELNNANEIMQAIPSQLQGVNELYSAISGYNQNKG